eukprot:SM000175S03273  [mRNA]  locus=s175:19904:20653:+ [translate_table: standard]
MAAEEDGERGGDGGGGGKEEWVKLISAEGFKFVVSRRAAMVSNTLHNMLSSSGAPSASPPPSLLPGRRFAVAAGLNAASCRRPRGFQETSSGEVRFPDISTPILEKLCQYFYYKLRYSDPANQKNIPEFKIDPEIALELLMAANYLDT